MFPCLVSLCICMRQWTFFRPCYSNLIQVTLTVCLVCDCCNLHGNSCERQCDLERHSSCDGARCAGSIYAKTWPTSTSIAGLAPESPGWTSACPWVKATGPEETHGGHGLQCAAWPQTVAGWTLWRVDSGSRRPIAEAAWEAKGSASCGHMTAYSLFADWVL